MEARNIVRKIAYWVSLLLIGLFPAGSIYAASDVASLWREHENATRVPAFSLDLSTMGNIAEFIVYLVFAVLGGFAIMSIFIGRLNMFLAGSGEDAYDSALSTFISGIVALILVTVAFVSLDYIFMLVREWSARMA